MPWDGLMLDVPMELFEVLSPDRAGFSQRSCLTQRSPAMDAINSSCSDVEDVADDVETGETAASLKPFTVKTKRRRCPTPSNASPQLDKARTFSRKHRHIRRKSRLFDEVEFRIEELKEELQSLCDKQGIKANGGTDVFSFRLISDCGREGVVHKLVDWHHVAEIANNFRPGSLALPTVTLRKIMSPTGKLLDIIVSLTDGVHRTVALKELGCTHIRALVHVVNDVRDEAQAYNDGNYTRRSHAKWDIIMRTPELSDAKRHDSDDHGGLRFRIPQRSARRQVAEARCSAHDRKSVTTGTVRMCCGAPCTC
jgi:hypothetical protein